MLYFVQHNIYFRALVAFLLCSVLANPVQSHGWPAAYPSCHRQGRAHLRDGQPLTSTLTLWVGESAHLDSPINQACTSGL